jgi:hypothetical protein
MKKRTLAPGEVAELTCGHSFRPVTVRIYHPGVHSLELQVNGHRYGKTDFTLGASS